MSVSLDLTSGNSSLLMINTAQAIAPAVICYWGPTVAQNMTVIMQRAGSALKTAQDKSSDCLIVLQARVEHVRTLGLKVSRATCSRVQDLQRKTFSWFQKTPEPKPREIFENADAIQRELGQAEIPRPIAERAADITLLAQLARKYFRQCRRQEIDQAEFDGKQFVEVEGDLPDSSADQSVTFDPVRENPLKEFEAELLQKSPNYQCERYIQDYQGFLPTREGYGTPLAQRAGNDSRPIMIMGQTRFQIPPYFDKHFIPAIAEHYRVHFFYFDTFAQYCEQVRLATLAGEVMGILWHVHGLVNNGTLGIDGPNVGVNFTHGNWGQCLHGVNRNARMILYSCGTGGEGAYPFAQHVADQSGLVVTAPETPYYHVGDIVVENPLPLQVRFRSRDYPDGEHPDGDVTRTFHPMDMDPASRLQAIDATNELSETAMGISKAAWYGDFKRAWEILNTKRLSLVARGFAMRGAAKHGKLEFMKAVLAKGRVRAHYMDYSLADAALNGHQDVVEYILSIYKPHMSWIARATIGAIKSGNERLVQMFLDNYVQEFSIYDRGMVYAHAVGLRSMKILQQVRDSGRLYLNAVNYALCKAVSMKWSAATSYLLNNAAGKVHFQMKKAMTRLAFWRRDTETMEALTE